MTMSISTSSGCNHGSKLTLCLSTIDTKISGERRTSGHDDRIVLRSDLLSRKGRIYTNVRSGDEFDAFSSEKVDSSLQDKLLVEFHVLYGRSGQRNAKQHAQL